MGGRHAESQNQVLDFAPPGGGANDSSLSQDNGLGSATLADVKKLGTASGAEDDFPKGEVFLSGTPKVDDDCILDLSRPIWFFKQDANGATTTNEAKPEPIDPNSVGDSSKPYNHGGKPDSGFDKPGWTAENPPEKFKPHGPIALDEMRPYNRLDPDSSLESNLAVMFKGGQENIQQYNLPDGARLVTWENNGETNVVVINSNGDVWPQSYFTGSYNEHRFSNGARARFGDGGNSYTYTDAAGQTAVVQLRSPIVPPPPERHWKPQSRN